MRPAGFHVPAGTRSTNALTSWPPSPDLDASAAMRAASSEEAPNPRCSRSRFAMRDKSCTVGAGSEAAVLTSRSSSCGIFPPVARASSCVPWSAKRRSESRSCIAEGRVPRAARTQGKGLAPSANASCRSASIESLSAPSSSRAPRPIEAPSMASAYWPKPSSSSARRHNVFPEPSGPTSSASRARSFTAVRRAEIASRCGCEGAPTASASDGSETPGVNVLAPPRRALE